MHSSWKLLQCYLSLEPASRPRSPSIRSIRRQGSVLSGVSSASELGRPDIRRNLFQEQGNALTPQQLGVMGK